MQRCPHCHHALEDGLLPICWHCGRDTVVDSEKPAPAAPAATAAPAPTPAPTASVLFDLDHLAAQLGLEPDPARQALTPPLPITAPPLVAPAPVAAPPPAVAPPFVTAAPVVTPQPVAAPAESFFDSQPVVTPPPLQTFEPLIASEPPLSQEPPIEPQPIFKRKLAVPAALASLTSARFSDWQRYRLPILGVGGVGTILIALSLMGRPNPNADMSPAPATPPPTPAATAPPTAPTSSAAAVSAPAPTPAPTPAATEPAATAPAAPPAAASAPEPAPAPVAVAAQAPPAASVRNAPSDVQVDEAPGWVVPRRVGYGSDGSRMLTLQLAALRDVQVSLQHVRPVLAVRCLSRRTEVFVALGVSAAIEAGDTNRVTVQFDEQTPIAQQWIRTDTYQELFAPDGIALARQLASVGLLRFTFTPFGSRPVVAEFNVKGFDQHVAMVARTCSWPVQGGATARKR
jgi:hypothetical protein